MVSFFSKSTISFIAKYANVLANSYFFDDTKLELKNNYLVEVSDKTSPSFY